MLEFWNLKILEWWESLEIFGKEVHPRSYLFIRKSSLSIVFGREQMKVATHKGESH